MKKIILIGVSGGIAAFKALELVRFLKKDNYEVRVIMTKNAAHMIDPRAFEEESGHPVRIELFEHGFDYKKSS